MNPILQNRLVNFFINLLIRLRILIFKTNGRLALDYHWKRRIIMLSHLNRNAKQKNGIDFPELQKKSIAFLSSNFNGYKDPSWSLFYSGLNGIADYRYIPEDLYYDIIEKKLNSQDLIKAYKDKNMYDKLLPAVNFPKTVARIMKGRMYNRNYQPMHWEELQRLGQGDCKLVLKPAIDSGGGKNVVIDNASAIIKDIESILINDENRNLKNYIVQECIDQHPDIARFHSKSINTIRIMTLRIDDEIVHLSSMFRMGRSSSISDNLTNGGIGCGVDAEGRLKKYAYDKLFKSFEKHPDTGLRFEGEAAPRYSELVDMVVELHKNVIYFDIISWDVAPGLNNKLYVIEMNLYYQGLNHLQVANGPIFGGNTERVLEALNGNREAAAYRGSGLVGATRFYF